MNKKIQSLIAIAKNMMKDAVTQTDVKNVMTITVSNIRDFLKEEGEEARVSYSGRRIQIAYIEHDEEYVV